MNLTARIPATAALLLSLGLMTGCQQLKARDQINKGVQSFKNAQYEQATQHFQQAIELDPKLDSAKLYLATAYAYQVVPNLTTPENLKVAHSAIDIFQDYLTAHPNDKNSLQQLASIYRNIKDVPKAKEYEEKVIAVDPKDPEAHYTIGAVNFVEAYNNAVKVLGGENLQDKGDGNPKLSKGGCAKLTTLNQGLVTEGIDNLNQAVQLRDNYDDAMQYLNLMYRRKADLECGNDAARKADLAQADAWVQKALGARDANEKKKEEKARGGVVMDK